MSEEAESAVSLRRGSRVKRPTTRYSVEPPERPARESTRKRTHREPESSRAKRARSSSATDEVVNEDDAQASGSDEDEDDDDAVYCLCRKGNDGSPMICCSLCGEWYHFKCVGLNQRSASKIREYVCESCSKQGNKSTEKHKDDDAEYEQEADEEDEEEVNPDEEDDNDEDAEPESASEEEEPAKRSSRTHTRRTTAPTTSFTSSPSSASKLKDPVRKHVYSTFLSIFQPLFEAQGQASSSAEKYASDLEDALFSALGHERSLSAYKERFRALSFNLKDRRNTSLHDRITCGRLPAADIVHMSNEALANDEIREATERAKRDALQQSVLREQNEGPARKMTHKGEVDIERDTEPVPFNPHHSRSAPPPLDEADEEKQGSEEVPVPSSPTFSPSRNASGLTEALPSPSPPPEPISFSGVWHSHPEGSHMDVEDTIDNEQAKELGIDTHGEADEFIDSFLGDDKPSGTTSVPESHTPPGTPPPDSFVVRAAASASAPTVSASTSFAQPVVWDGVITMPEYTSAYVHARQLTLPYYDAAAPLWQDIFPTPERVVEGRLPSATAIEYLDQVRVSPRNEIVLLCLDAGGAVAASERHHDTTPTLHTSPALDKLVHYFADKKRFGVLAPAPGAQGSLVKDFYLAPLLANEPVPEWLTSIHPEGLGEAWNTTRPANILLVVLVLFKAGMAGRLEAMPATPAVPAMSPPPGPPVSLDSLLNVKPDAIQNLLSTLNGGGASPGAGLAGFSAPPRPPGPPGPPPMPPMPPVNMTITPGTASNVPIARPMRPWGGVTPPGPLQGYGAPMPPPFGGPRPYEAPHPFPVGPGGWYGGNPERSSERSRRKGSGGGRRRR